MDLDVQTGSGSQLWEKLDPDPSFFHTTLQPWCVGAGLAVPVYPGGECAGQGRDGDDHHSHPHRHVQQC